MYLLENSTQPYAWGSKTALAQLLGTKATGSPQAELWMGAHPIAPSQVVDGTRRVPLDAFIAEAPTRLLGDDVARRFSGKLPFLFKVLAAETPLSLQAHPSLAQARAGFSEETARGIPLTAPNRSYKDTNHKPELLCAVTPFEALCGFRPVNELLSLFRELSVAALSSNLEALEQRPDARGLQEVFAALMTLAPAERNTLVSEVVAACERLTNQDGPFADSCRWAVKLASQYPGDAGVVTSLMLNLLHLAPGEAVYLPAGNLHAYLSGTGMEIMASSDNVLRGGLTEKHVDVAELLKVLDFTPDKRVPVPPARVGSELAWPTPAEEFRLSKLSASSAPIDGALPGPAIVLCVEGRVRLERGDDTLELTKGQSAFLPARDRTLTIAGDGELYLATVNG